MFKGRITLAFSILALAAGLSPSAEAQCDLSGSPRTTLRTPLIEGAQSTPPLMQAPEGQAPPVGDGAVPAGVTPGMGGGPTLLPAMPTTPANQIDYPSYTIPFDPSEQSMPGQYGPSTWAPPPPSTPGCDPGMIHAPMNFYRPPVSVVPINPGGGISGCAPTQRWGGQTTADFGRYKYQGKRAYDYGCEQWGSTAEDGPCQTRPGAVPTQDLYGRRYPCRNNSEPTIQTIAPY